MGGCQILRGGSFLFKGVKGVTTFLQILLQGRWGMLIHLPIWFVGTFVKKTRQTKKVPLLGGGGTDWGGHKTFG